MAINLLLIFYIDRRYNTKEQSCRDNHQDILIRDSAAKLDQFLVVNIVLTKTSKQIQQPVQRWPLYHVLACISTYTSDGVIPITACHGGMTGHCEWYLPACLMLFILISKCLRMIVEYDQVLANDNKSWAWPATQINSADILAQFFLNTMFIALIHTRAVEWVNLFREDCTTRNAFWTQFDWQCKIYEKQNIQRNLYCSRALQPSLCKDVQGKWAVICFTSTACS